MSGLLVPCSCTSMGGCVIGVKGLAGGEVMGASDYQHKTAVKKDDPKNGIAVHS